LACAFSFMLLLTVTTIAAVAALDKATDLAADQLLIRRRPVSTALFELLWAAFILQQTRNEVLQSYWKWNVVGALSYTARAVEVGIPRLVSIDDLSTRTMVRRRLITASHAINRLSRDVMLGDKQARLAVLAQIQRAAEAVLVQSYGELPDLSDGEEVERQQELLRAVRRRFGRIAWQAFVAVLPLTVVSAVRLSPLGVPAEALGAITTLAVGWLVIKLLGVIDPAYRESLAGAQAMVNEIRGGGPR
jgi:hypothetical protein